LYNSNWNKRNIGLAPSFYTILFILFKDTKLFLKVNSLISQSICRYRNKKNVFRNPLEEPEQSLSDILSITLGRKLLVKNIFLLKISIILTKIIYSIQKVRNNIFINPSYLTVPQLRNTHYLI
jgi:hypothetical protein